MLLAPLLLVALVAAPAQDKKDPPLDPKRIDAAVAELDAAFKEGKSPEERIAAIKKNVEVVDARVVAAIDKGLKDKDAGVQTAAVDALGRMQHPDALEGLHKFLKGEQKRLKDDEKLLPLVLKSIGRHGNEKSVEVLADDPFMQRTFPALQARVMSLGNIRSKKSVEALIEMMNKAGPRQVNDYMMLFRNSLWRLTGADQGPDSAMWAKWWQDNKGKFEMPKEVPKMPQIAEDAWNTFWEITPPKKEEGGEKKGG
jgi:HEAT repeat protein